MMDCKSIVLVNPTVFCIHCVSVWCVFTPLEIMYSGRDMLTVFLKTIPLFSFDLFFSSHFSSLWRRIVGRDFCPIAELPRWNIYKLGQLLRKGKLFRFISTLNFVLCDKRRITD